jgi:hypothetical protein
VKIEIEGKDWTEVCEKLVKLAALVSVFIPGDAQPGTVQSVEGVPLTGELPPQELPKKKPGRPKKTEPAAVEAPATEAAAPAPAVPVPSKEAVYAALQKVADNSGMSVARGILVEFKASRISELAEENFAAFIAKCEALVAGKKAATA